MTQTYFGNELLDPDKARLLPARMLAHLGDSVFSLYERERELSSSVSVNEMHRKTARRASAETQAACLEKLETHLNETEMDLVRRARNIKQTRNDRAYRHATAFEALVGYLYLTSPERLKTLLDLTV